VNPDQAAGYMKDYAWYNYAGAGMVSFWLALLFMLMLGFSYSYFWTAFSMVYLLMRQKVDEVEIDEIYTEEEEIEEPVPLKPSAAPAPTSIPVDAPTLRVTPPAAPVAPPAVPPTTIAPSTTDAPTSSATPASPTEDRPPESA
jgi:hypothetical protein